MTTQTHKGAMKFFNTKTREDFWMYHHGKGFFSELRGSELYKEETLRKINKARLTETHTLERGSGRGR